MITSSVCILKSHEELAVTNLHYFQHHHLYHHYYYYYCSILQAVVCNKSYALYKHNNLQTLYQPIDIVNNNVYQQNVILSLLLLLLLLCGSISQVCSKYWHFFDLIKVPARSRLSIPDLLGIRHGLRGNFPQQYCIKYHIIIKNQYTVLTARRVIEIKKQMMRPAIYGMS